VLRGCNSYLLKASLYMKAMNLLNLLFSWIFLLLNKPHLSPILMKWHAALLHHTKKSLIWILEHLQEYPFSLPNPWFLARWEKIPLQQLLIHAPKIYALGKSSPATRNFTRSSGRADPMRIDQSKGGRVWKIISRKGFLMQMYERERIYKSGYDNLEIV
jgi:hypothetical protein